MKISLDWLSNFIDITEKDHDKIKEIITARSAEIETMEKVGEHLDKIVVGQVTKIWPHPNADKLQLTKVDNGQEEVQVVCGGSNLKEGMKVAFAQLGAVVKWHGTDVVKMEKVKIRGEESLGMICAAEEIGLDEMFPKQEEHEIVDLSHLDAPIGTPLAKALSLDDTVINIDNHAITNRPDLFSHRGFAREFVANGLGKWKKQTTNPPEKGDPGLPGGGSPPPITVQIHDKDVCSNYLGVYLTGIEVKESPDWMKKHLSNCGIRPISNIVDITNYVMLELGMPLHAFDLDQIKGHKWTMRKSKKGEKIITLDEKEIELSENITVFDDGHELFDLCGIVGGHHSGINYKTNRVWLHAPVYNPSLTRRAVRGLNQTSDAATIYEKGVDNELAPEGLARAIQLILKLCPDAKVASETVHIQNYKPENRVIELREERIQKLIGTDIPKKEVKKILTSLGFDLKEKKDSYEVTVPSWRLGDVRMEADLIEEVARIYSYDNIPFTAPTTDIKPVAPNKRRVYERELKNNLVAIGFNEIYTFAFLGPEMIKKAGLELTKESIELANPISSDLSIMRQSLLPWTLEMIADNLRYQNQFRLFELSRTYHKADKGVDEKSELIMACVGESLRELQGVVEAIGMTLRPLEPKACAAYQHPGRSADLMLRGQKVGSFYELHPQIRKNFDLKAKVTVAEINMDVIHEMKIDHNLKFVEIPKYPAVELDVSILIPKKELAENYFKAIKKTDQTLIKDIQLIDEYAGQNIEAGKRSITYSITYRSDKETLTEDQVATIHKKVLANLKTKGAVIRD